MRWWKRRKKPRRNIIKISAGDNGLIDGKVAIIIFLVCIGIMLIIGEAHS